jgi:GMP synthase (glutamine-hydrolysing)
MHVLSVIHGDDARAELFAPTIEQAGHSLDEWSFAWDAPPPRPLESYDAVLVFGGAMHADHDDAHPWLGPETAWLVELLERRTPVLGICLGVQLIARATGAWVGPLPEAEIGWHDVELTAAGAGDPVLGAMPQTFTAMQWHHYTYAVPRGAVELARSPSCTQAFRLGDTCWGVQFHPEVTQSQVDGWIADGSDPPPDPERLRAETTRHIARWNELGHTLCTAFLETAERVLERAA